MRAPLAPRAPSLCAHAGFAPRPQRPVPTARPPPSALPCATTFRHTLQPRSPLSEASSQPRALCEYNFPLSQASGRDQQMHPPDLLPLSAPLVPVPIWMPAVVLGSTSPFSMRDMTARATLRKHSSTPSPGGRKCPWGTGASCCGHRTSKRKRLHAGGSRRGLRLRSDQAGWWSGVARGSPEGPFFHRAVLAGHGARLEEHKVVLLRKARRLQERHLPL